MNTSQQSASADTAWTSHHEPPTPEAAWTAAHFSTLVDLIRHCDDQITSAHRYHMLAIGAMIPILAILLNIKVPVYAFFGTVFLGAALGVRWLTLTSKLNLEKMCWVSLARQVEERILADPPGPFSAQQAFFGSLPGHLSNRDKIVVRWVGTKKLYLISLALFTLAVISVGLAAIWGWLAIPL